MCVQTHQVHPLYGWVCWVCWVCCCYHLGGVASLLYHLTKRNFLCPTAFVALAFAVAKSHDVLSKTQVAAGGTACGEDHQAQDVNASSSKVEGSTIKDHYVFAVGKCDRDRNTTGD
eukprot:m.359802 g.359802  ORF g.359802 m.359802 type:complete len:116 (+) comp18740_c0_seq1:572-919(+)